MVQNLRSGGGNPLDHENPKYDDDTDGFVDNFDFVVTDDGTVLEEHAVGMDFDDPVLVTDNGDGTVTITADLADVSEDGNTVVTDASDINFTTNMTVTDDGDGTVTVESSDTQTTDTRTDVSDGGSTVVSDVTDINFDSNLEVTDDGDGTVTVQGSDTNTDTRTDVSEDGNQVVAEVQDINFADAVTVNDDADGTVTVQVRTDTYDGIPFPSYATTGDVPALNEAQVVYVSGDGALYVEDGT